MADARNDQEPSIEEILASIREIISDEEPTSHQDSSEQDDSSTSDARNASVEHSFESNDVDMIPDDDDDILDLSNFAITDTDEADPMADDMLVSDADLPDDAIAFDEPIQEEQSEPEPEPEPEPVYTPAPAPVAAAPVAPAPEPQKPIESLLNEQAKVASLGALTKLAQNIAIAKSAEGNTLEDLVRDMLRPMLSEWLDSNLPPMIERMVERELERLVKQALDR